MYNILLNRYYITNANRSIASAEIQEKVQGLLANAKIGEVRASDAATSLRGKGPHEHLQRELEGLWMRHLGREVKQQEDFNSSFCKKN